MTAVRFVILGDIMIKQHSDCCQIRTPTLFTVLSLWPITAVKMFLIVVKLDKCLIFAPRDGIIENYGPSILENVIVNIWYILTVFFLVLELTREFLTAVKLQK